MNGCWPLTVVGSWTTYLKCLTPISVHASQCLAIWPESTYLRHHYHGKIAHHNTHTHTHTHSLPCLARQQAIQQCALSCGPYNIKMSVVEQLSSKFGREWNTKLEQLEHLHCEDIPRRPSITHTIDSYWIPSQNKTSNLQISRICQTLQLFEFWIKAQHTFWSCLIRSVNMKWTQQVLLNIQSGHDSVHRRTDRQTDKVKPVYPLSTLLKGGYNENTVFRKTRGINYLYENYSHKTAMLQLTSFTIAMNAMVKFHLFRPS